MIPLKIEGFTRKLGERQEEFITLAIRDVPHNGENLMMSLWEPTPAELKMLNEGGSIRLTIMGMVHPAVSLDTQPAPSVNT